MQCPAPGPIGWLLSLLVFILVAVLFTIGHLPATLAGLLALLALARLL